LNNIQRSAHISSDKPRFAILEYRAHRAELCILEYGQFVRNSYLLDCLMILSVLIRRPGIFQAGLLIVACLAQALPIALIPEQFPVTTVRLDVVDDRRLNVPSLCQTHYTQRMCGKVLFSDSLPGIPVAAG
jgi:hypothetical protein